MSVRQALLALLEQGPMYGYQLRSEFERRTGSTWPLNVGQVYTTLTRLERDGLVAESGDDGEGHVVYRVTDAGRDEVAAWFTTPVERTQPPRDELAIKLALAVTVPGVDVGSVIQQQRTATVSRPAGLHPAQAGRPGGRTQATRATWPGAWSSTRWCSRPRPRSAGSTTARPGSAAPSSTAATTPATAAQPTSRKEAKR